ncbi:MAG: lipoate--protein ligase family protein [Bacteroidia bacterium]|nr:lipoate--protein ligase family protein [Bacteroidia bacterium]
MKIILSSSTEPSFNLAAEQYLLSHNEPYLFLYVNVACVVIGYNQAVMNEVDLNFCIENDISINRRLSGGGAVYHDLGNLNYCFIFNKTNAPLSADFLLPVVHGLQQLEIPVEIRKRKDLWLPGGHKISGTASHVSKGRELHHGTLLYDTDLGKLLRALNPFSRNLVAKASPSVPSPVKNIRSYLKEEGKNVFSFSGFVDRFIAEMKEFYQIKTLISFTKDDLEAIETIRQEKYSKSEWNYKM